MIGKGLEAGVEAPGNWTLQSKEVMTTLGSVSDDFFLCLFVDFSHPEVKRWL
jgi:hypothetical protein